MSQKVKINFLFILTLALLSMLPPLGVDMYLPAFLLIAKDLSVSPEQIQHTLTFFAYGMAIGQIFWGPVGDSVGRKPVILLGVMVSACASLVLTQTNTIGNFTLFRFMQGFFTAAPVVLVGAILRDLFSKNELSKIMSTITLVFMLAPLLAPIIGGYLVTWFHWHSIFYFIAYVGLVCLLLMWRIIPETHLKENRQPLHLKVIGRNFLTLWKHKEVLGYMFSSAFGFGAMFAFLTAGSIVYIGVYGVAVENFGYFFMLNIGVMVFTSYLNRKFVSKIGAEKMLQLGLLTQFISAIVLLLIGLLDLGFWPMTIVIAILVGQNPLVAANAMASILEKFPNMAGTANSMAGSVRFATGAIVGSLMALIKIESATPMLLVMALCCFIGSFCYYVLIYRKA